MIVRVLLAAEPAPAVVAAATCHMIAPFNLLNAGFALWAVANVSVLSSPPIEVRVHVRVTLASVPGLPTLEAHLEAALTVDAVAFARLGDESVAVRACAPLMVRVSADIDVLLEFQVLLEYLLRTELSYIFSSIFSSA